jgi:hypothetical protein
MQIKKKKSNLRSEGYDIQVMPWLFICLLSCAVIFFLYPSLFNADHTFHPFELFPRLDPIGKDLSYNLDFSQAWLKNGSPYVGSNYYPPLETVFFAPLTALDFSLAYKIITFLSLLAYVAMFGLLLLLRRESLFRSGWTIAILLTGVFSYGVLFELERGQYDLIAMALCIGAIYLFHFKPRYRIPAYVLFCLAIQLKVYPLIFIVAFIDYSQPVSTQIKRWGGLLLANFLLLFSIGLQPFLDFKQAMLTQLQYPGFAWLGNHSINSFMTLPRFKPEDYSQNTIQFVEQYGTFIQLVLLALVVVCLLFLVILTYRKRLAPYNPYLILGCTLSCMLVPSTSHDYKLSLLGPVVVYLALTLSEIKLRDKQSAIWMSLISGIISLLFSISLSVLYYRPFWLQNSFPLLMGMLLLVVLLFGMLIYRRDVTERNYARTGRS